jgi:hypothetical protein
MTSIRQGAGCCMDLVRLEDALERPIVFVMGVGVVAEAGGGVVIPGQRDREQMCHHFSGRKEYNKFTEGHAAQHAAHFWLDLQRFFLACVGSCSFPSSFTTATSSVNLLPSVYNVASSGTAKLWNFVCEDRASKATSQRRKTENRACPLVR